MTDLDPIIEFNSVDFSYDGQSKALSDIDLAIEPGSFVCVLGGNGSGKSTLARHVNALAIPDAGCVTVLGRDTSDPASTLFVRSHAGMVFQNPDDQIVASVIENDVAFGPENLGVPSDELRLRVDAALEQVGLQGFAKKQTETLSGGQKQRVAVAGALAMDPQILVFDEAGAMLDPRGRTGLLRVCRELNAEGLTIVLITHFMEEAALADRVIVLEDGVVALDGTPEEVLVQAERLAALSLEVPFTARIGSALRERGLPIEPSIDEEELARELEGMLGTAASGMASRETPDNLVEEDTFSSPGGQPAIEFEGVSYTYEATSKKRRRKSASKEVAKRDGWGRSPDAYWAVENLSFSILEGELFGIAGHTGSGKSTLLQLACGLLDPNAGAVRFGGNVLGRKGAVEAVRAGVGVAFQYPERQLFAATVFDDVAFGPRNLGRSADQVEQDVRDALDMVHLDFETLYERNPFELSGGQQRRIALAGVLAMRPRTLLLDEPAAGLDPLSKRRLLDLLTELHNDGRMTMAIVSHDMNDLAALCNRILVLNEGRLFALGTPAEVFADEPRMKDIGLGVPHTTHLVNRLAASGVHLPVRTVPTLDELAHAIAAQAARTRTVV